MKYSFIHALPLKENFTVASRLTVLACLSTYR